MTKTKTQPEVVETETLNNEVIITQQGIEETTDVVETPTGEVPPVVETPTGEVPPVVETPTGEVPPVVETPTGEVPPVVETPTGEVPPVETSIEENLDHKREEFLKECEERLKKLDWFQYEIYGRHFKVETAKSEVSKDNIVINNKKVTLDRIRLFYKDFKVFYPSTKDGVQFLRFLNENFKLFN